jgi:HD-GYP domain-containing protein (c-di-GMP phosphodiesterase class II)/methylmalonyl-CoA mutase cobalamin-binding subunit
MGRPERRSKLGRVGRQPTAHDRGAARRRALRIWGPPAGRSDALTAAIAAVAIVLVIVVALATHGTVLLVASAVLLAALAGLAGWHAGEHRRRSLQRQIDDRSSELHRALNELEIAQAETVRRLSMAVEFRDEDTGAHIERIGRFATLLAQQLGLEAELCQLLSHAAPLHDIGKVAIPDAILLKPGPLTPEERSIVETHAEEGHRLLRGSSSSILDMAATIALSHHEKWDGSGYPRGLAGEDIPLEGRIVAVADVFDALTSDRVYRLAFSVEQALELMIDQRGRHFDPVLLDAFLEVLSNFGPDARPELKANPQALLEAVLETFSEAIERGDAETAEGVIAQAIEDGIPPVTLHGEVIAPALRRLGQLWQAGHIDADSERLATGIVRRILATLYRYMLGPAGPPRGRVLLAGLQSDDHTLGLQMIHDQLAAAGYHTVLDVNLSPPQLLASIDNNDPHLLIVGLASGSARPDLDQLVDELHESHPGILVLLGGLTAGAAPGDLARSHSGARVLERIDQAVPAVEDLLDSREHALG